MASKNTLFTNAASEDSLSSQKDVEKAENPENTEKPFLFNEQTNYVSKRKIITIFIACASVDFLALMDQTTLSASLSTISNALNANNQASWIAAGYFVTTTCFQLIYGRLSDIWSRKIILLIGLAIFFLGSLASSLANSALQLIIFRAFTGVGGGGLMTIAQTIVSDVVPLRERGKYQGILGSAVAVANAVGPIVGGALVSISKDSWRWIFRLNLPLTVMTTCFCVFFMPLKKVTGDWKRKVQAIDFIGCFFALSGTSVLLIGLTWGGGEYAWSSAHVIATLVVGVLVSIAFVLWEWKGGAVAPLVPMRIFKVRLVNGACATMFINGWNFLTQVYYIPMFYQLVYGYSPVKAGSLLLPITLTQTLFSTLSGLVVHWVGRYRECILFGWLAWTAGLALFSTLDETSGLGKQVGYGILTGVGVGNTLQPALIAIQAGAVKQDMAVVTSFRNFIRNLGGTLGLAIAGTIANNVVRSSLSTTPLNQRQIHSLLTNPHSYLASLPEQQAKEIKEVLVPAYRKSFRIVFIVNAVLAGFAFLLAWWLMPQVGLGGKGEKQDKEEKKEEGVVKKQENRVEGEKIDGKS